MNSYLRGLDDGRNNRRNDRVRTYQTDKAEKNYWLGYVKGMREAFPGKVLVKCERDGNIFAVDSLDVETIQCPVCTRIYVKYKKKFVADRELTIVK